MLKELKSLKQLIPYYPVIVAYSFLLGLAFNIGMSFVLDYHILNIMGLYDHLNSAIFGFYALAYGLTLVFLALGFAYLIELKWKLNILYYCIIGGLLILDSVLQILEIFGFIDYFNKPRTISFVVSIISYGFFMTIFVRGKTGEEFNNGCANIFYINLLFAPLVCCYYGYAITKGEDFFVTNKFGIEYDAYFVETNQVLIKVFESGVLIKNPDNSYEYQYYNKPEKILFKNPT